VGEWGERVGVCGCGVRESGKTSLYNNLSKNHVPGIKLMSLEWRNKWNIFVANFICFGVTVRLLTGGTHGMRCRQLLIVTKRVAVKWEGEFWGYTITHSLRVNTRKQGSTTSLKDADYRGLCVCVCVCVCVLILCYTV
jgi:hypothetical protein